ncbi:hypothetical protein LTR78_003734 [Recurvomyces mirabilis]|uniref:Uncharacterized protein n=1 Tax=Recurvomyces mirabilis TaxID=574656 RepID=A0AAE0WR29_9PEZI|nr:hypothetical protein LTR78_003734 [Recurvomyces mirabilis]KAK5154846.1 hypothetical protein LTS14_006427 [Recurvomyces mirabilis]
MIAAETSEEAVRGTLQINHGRDASSDDFMHGGDNQWRASSQGRNPLPAEPTERDIYDSHVPRNEPLPPYERLWSMAFNAYFLVLVLDMLVLGYIMYPQELHEQSTAKWYESASRFIIAECVVYEVGVAIAGYCLWKRVELILEEDGASKEGSA